MDEIREIEKRLSKLSDINLKSLLALAASELLQRHYNNTVKDEDQ